MYRFSTTIIKNGTMIFLEFKICMKNVSKVGTIIDNLKRRNGRKLLRSDTKLIKSMRT